MKSAILKLAIGCVIAWATVSGATANTFYVDPAKGSMDGDGSKSRPWSTLEEVFSKDLIETHRAATYPHTVDKPLEIKNPGAPIKAGDTIVLLSGYHGTISETGAYNKKTITIIAGEGQTPTLGSIHFRAASRWRFSRLTISPELADSFDAKAIVFFESHKHHGPTSHIAIEKSDIYSALDTSEWTADDWNAHAADGIALSGSDFVIRKNRIKNIHFGILAIGDDVVAESNTIENYSADGMRGGGDRVVFEGNTIEWAYKVDDNHDDAIQFYRGDHKPCRDVVLRGNTIRSHPDPMRPLVHSGQGLGMFNGPYINWVVENNAVLIAHYHGITLVGAQDSLIVNNTVLDATGNFQPWIQLKNSKNCSVINNLAMSYQSNNASGTKSKFNITLESDALDSCFMDWQKGDLRLKAGSQAIDAGTSIRAPTHDIDGRPRPMGSGVDVGAHEFVPVEDKGVSEKGR